MFGSHNERIARRQLVKDREEKTIEEGSVASGIGTARGALFRSDEEGICSRTKSSKKPDSSEAFAHLIVAQRERKLNKKKTLLRIHNQPS